MNYLILAAAGTGARFGSEIPKQFQSLDGRPLYLHSLATIEPFCQSGAVVVPPDWVERVRRELESLSWKERFQVVAGGAERQQSVWRGLRGLAAREGLVLVHDAARPFVSAALVQQNLRGAEQRGACIPAVAVADTIKEVEGSRVRRTLDRGTLRAVQTPQGFRLDLLISAFESAIKEGFIGTDEATLVERLGEPVAVVPGEQGNKKITWPEDLHP